MVVLLPVLSDATVRLPPQLAQRGRVQVSTVPRGAAGENEMSRYVKTLCNCDAVLTVAGPDVPHIEEMIETIRDWEEISREQLAEIAQLKERVARLQGELQQVRTR